MRNNLITIRQLDHQLLPLKEQVAHLLLKQGWVRTIRKALGMTIKQLAKRLGVDSSRVVKIETSEIEGRITVRTLKTVAETLDCTFFYGFIPKASFEESIKKRAKKIAKKQVQRSSHTMELEAQSVNEKWLEEQIKELTDELLRKSWKHLWEE